MSQNIHIIVLKCIVNVWLQLQNVLLLHGIYIKLYQICIKTVPICVEL